MKSFRMLILAFTLGALVLAPTACKKADEGAKGDKKAKTTGEDIKAKMKDGIDKAAEKTEGAIDAAAEKVDDAAAKVDEAAAKAEEAVK